MANKCAKRLSDLVIKSGNEAREQGRGERGLREEWIERGWIESSSAVTLAKFNLIRRGEGDGTRSEVSGKGNGKFAASLLT